MTFSYDITALDVELNKIRLYLGDTDSTDPLLEDEEIALIQADYTSFFRRLAGCCRLICSKLARRVNYRLSRLSEQSAVLYDRYEAMAARFDSMSSASYPWAGSILESYKETTEDDTSLVDPAFKRGMHNYYKSENDDD